MSGGRWLAGVAIAAVLVAVGAGLWVNGSPAEQRERRIDLRRIDDLRGLDLAVQRFHSRESRLPETLDELVARLADAPPEARQDPVDGQAYGYRPLDERRFELCARFAHPGSGRGPGQVPGGTRPWRHPAGRHCFIREIEPRDPPSR